MRDGATAVKDGALLRLSDTELGLIYRRVDEIKRRINEGTLDKDMTLRALQLVIEGKAREQHPCSRRHRSEPLAFKRPPLKERRRSKAPLKLRLPQWVNRLFFHYKSKLATNMWYSTSGRKLHPEDIMSMMWEAENIPCWSLNNGRVPVQTILDTETPTEREVAIISSALQWLGTNIGREFLVRYIRTADILV